MNKEIIVYTEEIDNSEELQEYVRRFDNLTEYDSILCVASFGLWYGRRDAQKRFNNLETALSTCAYEYNKVYFKNKNSTLNMQSTHHDGTNYYKFYKIINNKKYAIKLNEVMQ